MQYTDTKGKNAVKGNYVNDGSDKFDFTNGTFNRTEEDGEDVGY